MKNVSVWAYTFFLFFNVGVCYAMEWTNQEGGPPVFFEKAEKMPVPPLFDLAARQLPHVIAKTLGTTPEEVDWQGEEVVRSVQSMLKNIPSDCLEKVVQSLSKPISWHKSILNDEKVVCCEKKGQYPFGIGNSVDGYKTVPDTVNCQGKMIFYFGGEYSHHLFMRSECLFDGFVANYVKSFSGDNRTAIIALYYNNGREKLYTYDFSNAFDGCVAELDGVNGPSTNYLSVWPNKNYLFRIQDFEKGAIEKRSCNQKQIIDVNDHVNTKYYSGDIPSCITVNPKKGLLAIGLAHNDFILFDAETCNLFCRSGKEDTCSDLAFSRDGALLFSGGLKGEVSVFDVEKKVHRAQLSFGGLENSEDSLYMEKKEGFGPIHAMNCSDDGATFAVATERYDRVLWSLPAIKLAFLLKTSEAEK